MSAREPVLNPVRIKTLRPTQMTLGLREVNEKRKLWRGRGGGVYQPYRSIAKFHPLILASDLSEPFSLGEAATCRYQPTSGKFRSR